MRIKKDKNSYIKNKLNNNESKTRLIFKKNLKKTKKNQKKFIKNNQINKEMNINRYYPLCIKNRFNKKNCKNNHMKILIKHKNKFNNSNKKKKRN